MQAFDITMEIIAVTLDVGIVNVSAVFSFNAI